jgi:2-C-methyl-D-erythritol 4-phosphate cytidylyltransferase/2-C-methyl-D-erythritol 2,4-cyclodiphosphate synthase
MSHPTPGLTPKNVIALVVAAGRGRRFGAPIPKQYAKLGGMAVIRHCLTAFVRHPDIVAVRVVIGPDDHQDLAAACLGLNLLEPVIGGETRQDSVRLGLESLSELNPDLVLIHDAARPGLDRAVIDRVLTALNTTQGAIPALAVADTLKRGASGQIVETVPRADLYRAQTPQGFDYRTIRAAHKALVGMELTDDASLFEAAGRQVALVEGSLALDKITTADDLVRAERQWSSGLETRIGQGVDVHTFGPGNEIMLCGIGVPHSHGLVGHSDADVGLHAITDAILGALADGDIGQHFSPNDPRWRGADSALFLAHAGKLVTERGGQIRHVDVTIICEAPKVGPHRANMRARIAEILGLHLDRVSVKATTTEQMGFTGRREGIAAEAVATLALPAPIESAL